MTGRYETLWDCSITIVISSLKISNLYTIPCGFHRSPNEQNWMCNYANPVTFMFKVKIFSGSHCIHKIFYHIVGVFKVHKFREFHECSSFMKFNPSKNELPIAVLSFQQTQSWKLTISRIYVPLKSNYTVS